LSRLPPSARPCRLQPSPTVSSSRCISRKGPMPRLLTTARLCHIRSSPTPRWCIFRARRLPRLPTSATPTPPRNVSYQRSQLVHPPGGVLAPPHIGTSTSPSVLSYRRSQVVPVLGGPLPRYPPSATLTPPPVVSQRSIRLVKLPGVAPAMSPSIGTPAHRPSVSYRRT